MTEFSNNLMQMFQKGSPVARDVSKAILHLSEKAELKRLEEKWLITSPASCSNVTSDDTDSLKLRSLWILYVISGATSTICVLLSAIQSLVKSCHQCQAVAPEGNDTPSDHKVWEKDLPGFMESLVKQMSVNLKRLHSLGIKKVAVGLLQPIGCFPGLNVIFCRTNCIGLLNVISKDHNKMLLKAVQELNKEAAVKSVFITLDLYNSFLSAIETMQKKRAEKSTLMNPLQPCCEGNKLEDSCGSVDDEGSKKYSLCENPKLSFFWDTLHPSQNGWFAVYTILQSTLGQLIT
ncbi:GDSL esterase/lipase [Glycine max]|nr:GDSL esterase/lipase [Glycine max]